jgi:hypothetical protein
MNAVLPLENSPAVARGIRGPIPLNRPRCGKNHMRIPACGTRPRRIARCLLLSLLLISPGRINAQAEDEYVVKAAFLFNFTKFVEWPRAADLTVFGICIFGDDPFGPTLDALVKNKTAFGHPIQVRRLKDAEEAKQCQVVFAGRDEQNKVAKLFEAVQGKAVLTVGESHEFASSGGMIYLSMKDNRVGIVVNPPPAEKAGLKISAKLLSVAKNLKDDGEGKK